MFQVLEGTKVLAECSTLTQAAEALLRQNMGSGPRVVSEGETLIEVAWRFIPGDCYEPSGYEAYTAEARLAMRCARVMERVRGLINRRADDARKQLTGLSFQSTSSEGPVNVRLAWAPWPGFTLEIHSVADGAIVYSRWLDDALRGSYGDSETAPTLDYFVRKAAEFGVHLPENKVELIRHRSLLDPWARCA